MSNTGKLWCTCVCVYVYVCVCVNVCVYVLARCHVCVWVCESDAERERICVWSKLVYCIAKYLRKYTHQAHSGSLQAATIWAHTKPAPHNDPHAHAHLSKPQNM